VPWTVHISSLEQAVYAYATVRNLGFNTGMERLEPVLKEYFGKECLTVNQMKMLCASIPMEHPLSLISSIVICCSSSFLITIVK
jgi:hypothetical protein